MKPKLMTKISLYLPDVLIARVQKEADALGCTFAETVRQFIREGERVEKAKGRVAGGKEGA